MKPLLPQDETNQAERQQSLVEARNRYQFDYDYYDIGFAKNVPITDFYTPSALLSLAEGTAKFYANRAEAMASHAVHDIEQVATTVVDKAKALAEKVFGHKDTHKVVTALADAHREATGDNSLPGTEARYRDMFHSIKAPPAADYWDEDWFFAYQAVASVNPSHICRIDSIPDNFPVTDEIYRKATGDERGLARALEEKRVFLLDFSIYDGVPGSPVFGVQKYTVAPMVLLVWLETTERAGFGLTPVAIQCGQHPGPATPIFTPQDGYRWKMARYCAQAASGCYREGYDHFGTHVIMERCLLSTRRTLAHNHPLYILLSAHYQLTLATNEFTKKFTMPDSYITNLLSPPRDESMRLAVQFMDNFRLNESVPPVLFAKRGVEDPAVLPIYPFREDTTKVWNALREFVGAYVALYYQDDAAVVADTEVQAWVLELQAHEGGRLKGVGEGGEVKRVEALADLVAQIVYRASAYHAAINYIGFAVSAFPMCIPDAIFAPPPTFETPDTEEAFQQLLPPMVYAWLQFEFVHIEYAVWENQLGEYGKNYFEDTRVAAPLQVFQDQLARITVEIDEANGPKRRPAPYIRQLPKQITASLQA